MSNNASQWNNESWLAHLDEEYLFYKEGSVEHDVSSIIKRMLLSKDLKNAAGSAAYEINTYYSERRQGSGSTFNFEREDDPFPDFHHLLHTILIELPRFLLYSDPKQDALVQLLLELRNLPPHRVKVWNCDCPENPEELLFVDLLDNAWGGNFVRDRNEKTAPAEWEKECNEWVNFSSFIARCTQARILNHIPGFDRFPNLDIPEGLEKEFSPGLKRDTRVMVAAQYILLAGDVIDDEFVRKLAVGGSSDGKDKWQLWARQLNELAGKELAPEVKLAVVESRKKLISLHLELFLCLSVGANQMPD